MCNREVSLGFAAQEVPWLQSPAGSACLRQGMGRSIPGMQEPYWPWECSSALLCPQNSAVAPPGALGEGIGEGRHCLCGFVSPPSFLPRTLKSSTCGLGTASAAQGKRLPVAPAGLGTSVLAIKTWTVMCLKEYHFLGLQISGKHLPLPATPDFKLNPRPKHLRQLSEKQESLDGLQRTGKAGSAGKTFHLVKNAAQLYFTPSGQE